jgi:hypothetical protein
MFNAVSGTPPHRVYVRQRVRRGDPPEVVRVVHERRKEVHAQHERQVLAQAEDGGVVAARRTHQQPLIDLRRQSAHEWQQVGRRQLAPTAASPRECRQ